MFATPLCRMPGCLGGVCNLLRCAWNAGNLWDFAEGLLKRVVKMSQGLNWSQVEGSAIFQPFRRSLGYPDGPTPTDTHFQSRVLPSHLNHCCCVLSCRRGTLDTLFGQQQAHTVGLLWTGAQKHSGLSV